MNKILLIIFIVVLITGAAFIGFKFCNNNYEVALRPYSAEQNNTGGSGFLPIEPVVWDNPAKPMQSLELKESEIPKEAIRINIGGTGFSPSVFEVQKGKEVALILTGKDKWTHVLQFQDSSLSNIHIEVASGQTKGITFYAPSKTGEYSFACRVPGHSSTEQGKMVVK